MPKRIQCSLLRVSIGFCLCGIIGGRNKTLRDAFLNILKSLIPVQSPNRPKLKGRRLFAKLTYSLDPNVDSGIDLDFWGLNVEYHQISDTCFSPYTCWLQRMAPIVDGDLLDEANAADDDQEDPSSTAQSGGGARSYHGAGHTNCRRRTC